MKTNCNTILIGSKVLLVPYYPHHVDKYHTWMSSSELQELTASEPLTLEEEYNMQQSWMMDEDKCTFIVLDKAAYEETSNEVTAMIGDTNVFLARDPGVGEIEIMIAEKEFRGHGKGKEAALMMLKYCVEHLNFKTFEAKIGDSNVASLNMFRQFQFEVVSKSVVFKETTLSVSVTENWRSWLRSKVSTYFVDNYETNKKYSK
uniref:N-acetyltransferase 9-like protein n=1 Tax=Hirondellea gigas TaxID=1518452 RepID=A0A2P2I4P7_9CRUS